MKLRLRLPSIIFLLFYLFWLVAYPSPVQAQVYQPISPQQLGAEIDTFALLGAKGYLVWQYSGDRGGGQEFENDKYSFFRNNEPGSSICKVMKQKSEEYPDMFIGVNLWSAGDPKNSPAKLVDHFSYLKNDCGVSVIRVFAKAGGPAGMKRVADAAAAAGVKVIIALGDYSNGGGGVPQGAGKDWYESGYKGEYVSFVRSVIADVGSNNPGVFGYELANEPHCGGDGTALTAYTNWVSAMTGILAGAAPNIGIGQMASQDTTLCDSPGPNHYAITNSAAGLTMGSAHYYKKEERESAKSALAQLPAGKFFYIGEAGWGSGDELNPSDYYLYPLEGLEEGNKEQLRETLANQGYEVQCTSPKFKVDAIQAGDITKFLQFFPNAVFSLDTSLNLNYSSSEIPIWRSGTVNNSVNSSLENYFGFRDISSQNEQQRQVASAPLYTLLTSKQQCLQQVEILNTIDRMCNTLEDPTTCALYQPIPDSNYDTLSLLQTWNSASSNGLSCDGLADGWQERDGVDKETFNSIKKGLDHTPLYLNKAYRLAFLVIAAELKPNADNNFFSFLTPENQTATPKHEVRVVAFKIPDIGTNKDQGELNYRDPLQITRDVFLDYDTKLQDAVAAAEERQRLQGEVNSLVPAIDCSGTPTCSDPLVGALVEMIQASGKVCESNAQDLPYEPVNQIKDSGTITAEDPGRIFKNGFDLVKNLFTQPPEAQENPQQAEFNFLGTIRPQSPTKGPTDTDIKAFLIYPMGTEIRTVENTLIGRFYGYDAIERFEMNPPEDLKPYFKITGVTQDFESAEQEVRYIDPEKVANSDCELDGDYTDCESSNTFKITADTIDNEPRIFGGRLGFVIRSIQKAIYDVQSEMHAFVSSCQTTEDFLLGRCQTGSGSTGTGTSGEVCSINGGITKDPSNPSRWIGGEMIQSQLLKNLVARAAQKYNVPVQVLMATLWMENCRGAASICGLSDEQLKPYIESNAEYSANCPGGGSNEKPFTGQAKGVFQFYHNICRDLNGNGICDAGEPTTDWGTWREAPGDNICNIHDATYAAAKYLAYNYGRAANSAPPASQWTLADAQRALSRWAGNVDQCDQHPFAADYCRLVERLWSGDAKVETSCN